MNRQEMEDAQKWISPSSPSARFWPKTAPLTSFFSSIFPPGLAGSSSIRYSTGDHPPSQATRLNQDLLEERGEGGHEGEKPPLVRMQTHTQRVSSRPLASTSRNNALAVCPGIVWRTENVGIRFLSWNQRRLTFFAHFKDILLALLVQTLILTKKCNCGITKGINYLF